VDHKNSIEPAIQIKPNRRKIDFYSSDKKLNQLKTDVV
jgi:hypothetical protein